MSRAHAVGTKYEVAMNLWQGVPTGPPSTGPASSADTLEYDMFADNFVGFDPQFTAFVSRIYHGDISLIVPKGPLLFLVCALASTCLSPQVYEPLLRASQATQTMVSRASSTAGASWSMGCRLSTATTPWRAWHLLGDYIYPILSSVVVYAYLMCVV